MDCNGFILNVWSGFNLMWSNGWEFVICWSMCFDLFSWEIEWVGCHLLKLMGWVSFIEQSGFKCYWVGCHLLNIGGLNVEQYNSYGWHTFTFIMCRYGYLFGIQSFNSDEWGLKWLLFCTFEIDHFGSIYGFIFFLVGSIWFALLSIKILFMNSCGPNQCFGKLPNQCFGKFWT